MHNVSLRPIFLLVSLLSVLLTSCIERIDFGEGVADQYRRQLYIEGRIMSGAPSVFYVQHTIPMTQTQREYVENAEVRIVSDRGFVSSVATLGDDGAYTINTGTLNTAERYKLVVKAEGETYESDYLTLQPSLPIDSVWFKEQYREHVGYNLWTNDRVEIHVSAHGDAGDARHYMWTWEEDFEFHAPYDISLERGPLPGDAYPYYDASKWEGVVQKKANPYYYCWKHGQSSDYHLYSTANLAQNVVGDVVVATFEKLPLMLGISNANTNGLSPRFSSLYAITVHQSTLDSVAYSYYRQMEQYTEEMGGLFSPTPYDLYGNLHCTSHPDIRVRGNIIASEVSSYRLFIKRDQLHFRSLDYEPVAPLDLSTYRGELRVAELLSEGHVMGVDGPSSRRYTYVFYRPCLDCLQYKGATKQKPAWWPTENE